MQFQNRLFQGFLALCIVFVFATSVQASQPPSLSRGVNIDGWFSNFPGPEKQFKPERITAVDLEKIKSLGFTHVRLPIEPTLLFNQAHPADINSHYLVALDKGVHLILKAGLGVIIDMHSYDEPFKKTIASDSEFQNQFVLFWGVLAKHFATGDYAKSTDKLFFETLNEPGFAWKGVNSEKWTALQQQMIQAIRQNAPQNTIIVKSDLEEVRMDIQGKLLKNIPDKNIVYSSHFYDPMAFTHQGAVWVKAEKYDQLSNVPYPLTPQDVSHLIQTLSDLKAPDYVINFLKKYSYSGYGAAQIKETFAQLAAQAKANGYPIYLGEFGVLRGRMTEKSRNQWLTDVTAAAEANKFAWCLWEYNQGFGLVNQGKVDTNMLKALNPKQSEVQ